MTTSIDKHHKFRAKLEKLLEGSDIAFNGDKAWDIQVYNADLYERILNQGSVGLGEAYMDGWWNSEQIDELFCKICRAKINNKISINPHAIKTSLLSYFYNRQSQHLTSQFIKHHYDIGNDLYKAMLDKTLTYSCGYWHKANTLDQAQQHKFDLICRKLDLQPGQKILDMGCGWGGFMKYAAEHYRVSCVGITLSEEQHALSTALCAGLPIEIRLTDYRNLDEKFDHIASIGMFEHVGYKNYDHYMRVARNCLKNDGLFLLHTIGGNRSMIGTDSWMEKYIFPGGLLPSIKQIGKAIEDKFVLEDLHNFGPDYDKTLMSWFYNFDAGWHSIAKNYDKRFYRMWKYYLLSCAGTFRARENQLWQIVLSKNGVPGGYRSVR